MTDQEPSELEAGDEGENEDEAPAATPFDNPFFLPVIRGGLAAWFGFDIVTDDTACPDTETGLEVEVTRDAGDVLDTHVLVRCLIP